MDYQPLPTQSGEDENNPNMSVLLAVAQQDMVNYYVEMMLSAGLEPIAIDIEPLSAGRALLDIDNGQAVRRPLPGQMGSATMSDIDPYGANPKETVALVNIGATNTDISIFEDGLLIFPRSLALAGESLTKAISEGLGYQIDQAERMKMEHGRVLLDRVNDYNNQDFQPDAVEFPYGQAEEDFGTMRPIGLPDSGPLGRSAFDSGPASSRAPGDSNRPGTGPISGRINSGPLGSQSPFGTGPIGGGGFASPGALDLERTQPIQRRALDLARRGASVVGGPDQTASNATSNDPAVSELTVQIFDAILPVLSEMATELRRSLDYYRSRAAGKNVDRVILCGGTASLPGLDKYLDQELQVPVQVASPFNGLSVTSRQYDPSHIQTIAPLFTVAVGLAARPAVFAANPDPNAKKGRAPKAAPASKAAPAQVTGGGKGKSAFTMPTLFGKKGAKGDNKGNTTLPPTL
jgi:Tfp pilus assembly PilM family ATPase